VTGPEPTSSVTTPLAELVRTLGPPLDYLAADEFRRLERTRLPLPALAERLRLARTAAPPEAAAALAELETILEALRGGERPEPLLRRAHALLPALREIAAAPAAWTEYRPPNAPVAPALAALAQPVDALRAVGPKRSADLVRFRLCTVEDVLYHLPFRYEDRRALLPLHALRVGEEATATGEVAHVRETRAGRRGRRLLEVVLRDGDGLLLLVWFHGIPYFSRRLAAGQRLLVHGRVEPPLGGGPRRIIHPDIETLAAGEEVSARVVPVYEKPTEMHAGAMRRIVHAAVAELADRVPSALPAAVAARQRVVDLGRALRHVHIPPPEADLEALGAARSLAHRSLVFDELFFLQLGLALRRSAAGQEPGTPFPPSTRLVPALRARLPFVPTGAQERAFAEIAADLAAPHPMRRLLQGDVGSGKTLVALMAALAVIEAGHQAALMAPTELLAEQHYETVRPLVEPLGIAPVLLTGAVKGRARRSALGGIAAGETALAVGTHALIQEGVSFARLGLAVVDEQHRFGVLQRAALQRRGDGADPIDVLVMSATPIPRTLALTLYGDLAVSTLDELPPGRTPIQTEIHRESRRDRVYERVRREIAAGHQAYIVYPLVEESEKSALRAATTMVHELGAGPLAGLRLALVHGRMKAEEKDDVMRAFKAGAHDVLVSTTVIEVGIDVPNATAIVIEHAERFGLAQLHQLRGRVGRGTAPAHCFLVVPDWTGQEAYQRLRTLEETTDGFRIAEADLALRGPGDFLGTRQAGLPDFRVANLLRDTELLRAARDEVAAWLSHDPDLSRPESRPLRAVLAHRWQGRLGLARVG
jgi:ATP-dependent DNA helicase RecG